VHNTGIMHLWLYSSGRRYVDQLQSCRPEILYPNLSMTPPKTEILKNILVESLSPCCRNGLFEVSPDVHQSLLQLSRNIFGFFTRILPCIPNPLLGAHSSGEIKPAAVSYRNARIPRAILQCMVLLFLWKPHRWFSTNNKLFTHSE